MQEKQIIECVPNISEGIDKTKIRAIAEVVNSVDQVQLLHIDSGRSANRTVYTFAGTPKEVTEAAFRLIKKTSELIDMQKQKGVHPRFGATDVCPLIPIANISMEETVKYARQLAKRVGDELNIPVYCYEYAAMNKNRKNLAHCRKGGYEALKGKISEPVWTPDFGPALFNKKAGATAIGVRDFLIAYNINLNTTDIKKAKNIAASIRQEREAGKQPFKKVKAIGWFIEEFGFAQVSMNIINYNISPLADVYEKVKAMAHGVGIDVRGSEIVGMIPEDILVKAGQYFIERVESTTHKKQPIDAAIGHLGLNDLYTFNPKEKVLEYVLKKTGSSNEN